MPRFLAVDWDNFEIRFVLGKTTKGSLVLLKTGAVPYENTETASNEEVDSSESTALPITGDNVPGDSESINESPVPASLSSGIYEGEDEESDDDVAEKVVITPIKTPLISGRQERIAGHLKAILRQYRIEKTAVLFAAPRSEVEQLQLLLPKVPDSQLPDIVKNQAARESTNYVEKQPIDFLPLVSPAGGSSLQVVAVTVSPLRLKGLKTIFARSKRKLERLEFRPIALAELFLGQPGNFQEVPETSSPSTVFSGTAEPSSNQSVLVVCELHDEVHLLLLHEGQPEFVRTFMIPPNSSPQSYRQRLVLEITRTLAVASGALDRPPANRVLRLASTMNDSENSENDNLSFDGVEELLEAQGIICRTYNPFEDSRVSLNCPMPTDPGRYAALIGMLMAQQLQRKPLLDLLHPRQNPKPPNHLLLVAALLLLTSVLFGVAWKWNQLSLNRLKKDVSSLEKQRDQLAGIIQEAYPQYQQLSQAWQWDNAGVVLLDELRDITLRIPKAPDMIVTRLSYTGNYRGRPVFVISGKVTSLTVYQQFYQSLTVEQSHQIQTAGPKVLTDGGGFSHEFSAQIFAIRRPFNAYYSKLPQELSAISNEYPEFWQGRTTNEVSQ